MALCHLSPAGCSGRAAVPLGTARLVAAGTARGSQQRGELCPPSAPRWRRGAGMMRPRDPAPVLLAEGTGAT